MMNYFHRFLLRALRVLRAPASLAAPASIVALVGLTFGAPNAIGSVSVEFHNLTGKTVYLYESSGTFSYSGTGIGASGYTLNAGTPATFDITQIAGAGKIGFSIGDTLTDQTLGNFRTPTHPDYHKRYDKIELNVPSSGAPTFDITAQDFFSIPVHVYNKSDPSKVFGFNTGTDFAQTIGTIINASGANTSVTNQPYAALATGGTHGVTPSGVSGVSGVVRMVSASTVFAPPNPADAAYGSFETYVTDLSNAGAAVKVKRSPPSYAWDFTNSSWETPGATPDLKFTAGSLTVNGTTYEDVTLTVEKDRLTSEQIYLAANATGMNISGTTITGSNLVLESANFSSLSAGDIGDSSSFLVAVNGFLEDLYVGFQLGAWGSTVSVPAITTNIPVGGEAINSPTTLGALTSGQLLTLGANYGDKYFFGESGADFYNKYAEAIYAASGNRIYGFPYSDFLNKAGANPLLQGVSGDTIVVEILSDSAGHLMGSAAVYPIPEPSSYAAIAGFLALGWVMARRRRA